MSRPDVRRVALAATVALTLSACNDRPKSNESLPITSVTRTFVDPTRATPPNGAYAGAPMRTLVVEIWHPTSLTTKRPLVLFSHGLMDNRLGETYLAEALASAGYLVAAPDYPLSSTNAPGGATIADVAAQPLDLRFVIDSLLADATFGPAIDATKIGAAGLSLGGLTTLLAGYHHTLRDPRLRALLTIAAPACLFEPAFFSTSLPLYVLHGDADLIVPYAENGARLYANAPAPRHLVTFQRGTHTGFAGLAALFDPADHYDNVGCAAIASIDTSVDAAGTLGADDLGISHDPAACPARCATTGAGPVLPAATQQAITIEVTRAFFDDTLRDDARARAFLAGELAARHPEVTVK